ncbi:putative receptor-like protein kinase At3g47110 isoform X2 [Phragmites australis]|nr:putative receptor-like protein kinase At3g47110 isoform X2 [Phragmites australis]
MLGNTLPSNIGDALPNLRLLYLGMNYFEGYIPASLGNPSGLEQIDLSSNYFTGQIPSSFGKLLQLYYLNLEANELEARDSEGWEFFHGLANCSFLNELSLSNNQLQGPIPNSIANLSTNLIALHMGGNHLSGIIPTSIQKFSGLIDLGLDYNNLTGTIEDWIGKLTNLQTLRLQSNNFIGTVPPSIHNLTNLTVLSLANNKLTGFVPPSLGNLKPILMLNLSYNSFQGSIPAEFGNFRQLTELDLSANKFSGEIPETLGQFQQIQTIQMDQNFLTGNIPITFSNLKSLSMLNLSHNNLSGPMPACVNDLESLTKLDLSYNNFQGEIPNSGIFDNATIVSLDGNPGLCGGAMDLHMPSCRVVRRRKVEIVNYMVKILIPIFGFMSLIMFIYIIIHGNKTSRGPYILLLSFGKQFPKVSYKDLAQATGNFSESNLVGRGSYGSVYKGNLTQAKMQVAIKVFDLEMRYADKSFASECEVLRRIRHRNLLSILTACSTIDNTGNDFKALIYEFMQNGNLDTWLHHRRAGLPTKCLGLVQRMNIAVGIADALAYLHHDCGTPIVHCDLKPTNILLDDDMNAHLGDFGIASLVLDARSTKVGHAGPNNPVPVTGTIGYIAPEYAQSIHASTCGDVYSFGIVLLEMIIGKRPTDSMFEDELTMVSYVERNFPDKLLHIIDVHLREECKGFIQAAVESKNEAHRCLLSLVQVALSCTHLSPRERMNMREVAINLHSIRRSYVRAIKDEQVLVC